MMKVLTIVVAAALFVALPASLSADGVVQGGRVRVTVNYKGKGGTVDATHKLWVWLFDSPNIGAGSQPIDQAALDKNGAQAVFEGVSLGQVYVAVAFDEKGAMDGNGPPPTGTPISIHAGPNGAPMAVVPGEKGAITITFDDTARMQ